MASPPKPTLAALRPLRDVTRWWQPSLWADVSVWASGMSGSVVEYILIDDVPDAERICVGVAAMEKISAACAWGSVSRAR